METKSRILYLLKILEERTDEDHPLTTNQLIELLHREYGISAYRTTVSKDIAALVEYGIDIVTLHSTQCKYFVANRIFELPELKLLLDAVESSKFITPKKSRVLTEKLCTLTSEGEAAKLKRKHCIAGRVKPGNEQIYYIVDTINDAINMEKQIAFQYFEYTERKEKRLKNQGEVYRLSPYYLVWNNDFYYVVGFSDKKQKIVTFRVDRILSPPEITDEAARPEPSDFDIDAFTRQVFFMYDGDMTDVELRCDNSLMKTMIDRFGEDVATSSYDEISFRLCAKVSVSQTFFGWIFGFSGKIQVLGPEHVKEQYRSMIIQANREMMEH